LHFPQKDTFRFAFFYAGLKEKSSSPLPNSVPDLAFNSGWWFQLYLFSISGSNDCLQVEKMRVSRLLKAPLFHG